MKSKFYPISFFFLLFFQSSLFSQSFSLLKDINPGNNGSEVYNFCGVNNGLYFKATDGIGGYELWKSNGTTAGTAMVKDIFPGADGGDPQNLIALNGVLYFTADNGINGVELWKSNGTDVGTTIIKDIRPGSMGSNPTSIIDINGLLYFTANDGINGYELWKTDGTEAGTVLVKDIFPGVVPSGFNKGAPNNGNPNSFTSLNGIAYFAASSGSNKHEIWKTDGTTAGTEMIKDIYPGVPGSTLNNFISANGTIYFTVYGGANGTELWKTDGTTAGTALVKEFSIDFSNFSIYSTVLNGSLYFLGGDGIWRSDGTNAGTIMLKQTGSGYGLPEALITVNDQLFFTGYDDTHGMEFWKSDGTTGGTQLLKDINPGSGNSDIVALSKMGNKLIFSANDGIHGNEIWISDGTESGTNLLQDIEPGEESANPSQLIEFNGKVFTTLTTAASGTEIWVANAPADSPLPLELLEFKGSLVNNDGLLQWKTVNETNTIKFIVERSTDSRNYQAVGSVIAANSTGVHEYYFTDPNIVSLGTPIVYYRLKQIDIDGKYAYSGIVILEIGNKQKSIRLFPNPVKNQINLTINSYQNEKLQWRLVDNIGRIIKGGKYDVSPGNTAISEDVSFIAPGIYFMQLTNGADLQKVIKVIKQ